MNLNDVTARALVASRKVNIQENKKKHDNEDIGITSTRPGQLLNEVNV